MNRSRTITGAAMALLLTITSFASAQDTREHPGEAIVDWREQLGAEPKVSVNLNQALLRFVTSAASEAATEVPGLRDIVGQLWMVRVEVYEGLAEGTLAPAADAQAKKLRDAGWTTVVRATGDDNERVNVMMLDNGETIDGLVVIAAGPGEMAFVNIAGDLNPETLGKQLGALARLTHNGKVKLEDLINTEALEVLIEESGKGTKTTSPGNDFELPDEKKK